MDVLNFISKLSVNNRKFFMTLKEFYFDKCNFSYQDWEPKKNMFVQKEIKNTNNINLILNYKGKTLLSLLEKRLSKSLKFGPGPRPSFGAHAPISWATVRGGET